MPRSRAFTLFELLVAVAVIGLILASVIPFILEKREAAHRIACARNLSVLFNAMNAYAKDYHGYPRVRSTFAAAGVPATLPASQPATKPGEAMVSMAVKWTAYTGPDDADPFAAASAVQPDDVTASLWLLVRSGYVSDTGLFVCPSSDDWPDRLYDAKGSIVPAKRRGNFRSDHNLSYSMFNPFGPAVTRWGDDMQSGCALLADKNPGVTAHTDPTKPAKDASPEALGTANSPNHGGGGQNVLYTEGSVYFERGPYVGNGYLRSAQDAGGVWSVSRPGDNIYTALRPTTIPAGETPPGDGNGVIGKSVFPSWQWDSYLVPTAGD